MGSNIKKVDIPMAQTDGVTLFLKTHPIDQIILLSAYMRHLSDVEFKKEDSVNPFYINRSLPSWTLLAVLWQMCHVWITYRTSSGSVLMMDKLSRKYQKSTT